MSFVILNNKRRLLKSRKLFTIAITFGDSYFFSHSDFEWLFCLSSDITNAMKNTRVYVGLSGGVDSSVTAALLKQKGFEVIGVFLRPWQPDWIPCTWRQDRRDAIRVAAHLQIPFLEIDTSEEYKQEVVEYMIDGYKKGITPNPDILCNREIKFGIFKKWVDSHGGGIIATGHYAQTEDGKLLCGADPLKDQSYFLAGVSPIILKDVIFPLGGLPKTETRKLAEKFNLPTRAKKDSQGVCFLGMIDMKEFLSHYIEFIKGDIVNKNGEIIGTHDDTRLYTLGERHGFTVFDEFKKSHAWYVVDRDIEQNILVVDTQFIQKESETNYTIVLSSTVDHGISCYPATSGIQPLDYASGAVTVSQKLKAQMRYHGTRYPVTSYDVKSSTVTISSSEYPTVGQMLVVYDGQRIVWSGTIKQVTI